MDSVWYEILVIMLGSVLAIFLILAIVLTIKVIQIVKTIKLITEHAEKVADKAEHISAFFEKTATPIAFMKLISNLSDVLQKKGNKK